MRLTSSDALRRPSGFMEHFIALGAEIAATSRIVVSSRRSETKNPFYREACQNLGGGCTRGYPGCDVYGKASCGTCLECCLAGIPYPPKCKCRKCGFD